ncbi:MAG TPA: calcium-binding protein [Gaiellaceae bacterium]|nr:calcium-binding protein [Gaiellaceae bacterium]
MRHHLGIDRRSVWPTRLAAATIAAAGAAGIGAASGSASAHGHAYRASHHASSSSAVQASLENGLLSIEGSRGNDAIALRLKAGDPATIQVDAGDDGSADFEFPRASVARIALDAEQGDDVVRVDEANGVFDDKIPTTLDGGAGDDNLSGGSGAETLLGGSGDDRIDGNKGNDRSAMGSGNDTFVWDPGDGSDTIEGEDGYDTMLFNGAAAAEKVDLSANGNRLRFFRDVANITMDTAGVERVVFNALGGADVVTVHDLSGTDVKDVSVDESSPAGSGTGDNAADQVIVEGTAGNDRVAIVGGNGEARVVGLSETVDVSGAEPANDTLTIDALDGNDVVTAFRLSASAGKLAIDGGNGNDLLIGGGGDDVLAGGAGNDVLIGGPGRDTLDGGTGSNALIQ